MRKLLGLVLFVAFVAFSFPAYAGHDFMAEMRKITTLIEEESCSNGLIKIEHRVGEMMGKKILMTLIIFEPDAASKMSEFYRESNKDFYSLIFYRLYTVKNSSTIDSTYYMKKAQSGDLEELVVSRWHQAIKIADPNLAMGLMQQPESDCTATYHAPSR